MTIRAQAGKISPTQHDRVTERRSRDVLNYPGLADEIEGRPGRSDEVRVLVLLDLLRVRKRLARRGRMEYVEIVMVFEQELQRVSLMEFERVPGLQVNVDPNNIEAGPGVPGTGSSCATEQVK
jgi:hypothetical protein